MAKKIQRLPETPLFGPLAKTEVDSLETKKVWSQRLLYLLDTPLATEDLSKIDALQEIQEKYSLSGATLGDIMHLQQIIKAMNGDTKAYSAITKALGNATETPKTDNKLIDPLVKMTDMLYGALKTARNNEVIDADIVEVDENDMSSMFDDDPEDTNTIKVIEVTIEDREEYNEEVEN